MPSTAIYDRGHVIVVNVPFSNHTGIKPRPGWLFSSMRSTAICRISLSARFAASLAITETRDQGTVRFRSGGPSGFEYSQDFQDSGRRQENHKTSSGPVIS
jgi:hypothetical protein